MNTNISSIISLIRQNKWDSIFFQYLKRIFFLFMIPFLIAWIALYSVFMNSMENDFEKLINSSLQKINFTLSQSLSLVDKYFIDLSFSNEITSFLTTDYYENLTNSSKNTSYFRKQYNTIAHNCPNIQNIIIYSQYNDYVLSHNFSGKAELFHDYDWFEICSQNTNHSGFLSTPDNNSFYKYYKVIKHKQYVGHIIFQLSSESIHKTSENEDNLLDNLILVSHLHNIFYSNFDNSEIITNSFKEKAFSQDSYFENNGHYMLSSIKSYNSEYILISAINSTQLTENTKTFQITFFLVLLLFLVILLIISMFLSFHIYKSISKITSLLGETPDYSNENEFYYISQQILAITKHKNDIENTLINKIHELKKAQLVSLQGRITPHFVFNTLNLISAIVMNIVKKPNDAEKVIQILADTFYYSLHTESYIVNIKDEIHYAQKFIEIQHIKLKGDFDFNFDISPEIYQYKALKFMLQPIVENSFEHGISNLTDRKGIINIRMYAHENTLVCEVFDNGNKIDSDKLDEINRSLHSDNIYDHKHIGLKNIHHRISLIWGKNYGCNITSNDNGTTVTVKIPLIS